MKEKMREKKTPEKAWDEVSEKMRDERNVYVPDSFDIEDRMYEDQENAIRNEKHEQENVTQMQDNTKVKLKKHNWME